MNGSDDASVVGVAGGVADRVVGAGVEQAANPAAMTTANVAVRDVGIAQPPARPTANNVFTNTTASPDNRAPIAPPAT